MSHLGLDLLHAVMGLRRLTLAVSAIALLEFTAATLHAATRIRSIPAPYLGAKGLRAGFVSEKGR